MVKKSSIMSSIVGVQLLMMVFMYLGTFVSYYIPIRMFSKTINNRADGDLNQHKISGLDFIEEERQRKIYSNCNCIALGVFITMCFMQVPMVNEEFRKFLKESDLVINYPLSELTILLGFFMVLYFEQLFIKFRSSNNTPFLQLDDEMNDEQSCKLLAESSESILIDSVNAGNELECRSEEANIISTGNDKNKSLQNSFDHHHSHEDFHHHHHYNLDEFNNEINLSFIMLLCASSIHSVFEGLALGLIKQFGKSLNLFIGIFLHECIISFALGINAAKVNKGILFGLVFSATIPMGVLLGILIGYTPGMFGQFVSATVQGLVTGTFLQVAFVELMPPELHHQHPDKLLKKISLMFFGFILMAFIQLISD